MQATAGTWAPEKGKRNHYDGHIGHMDSTELFTKNVPTCKTNPSVCLPPENTHMTERNGTDGTSTGTEQNGTERRSACASCCDFLGPSEAVVFLLVPMLACLE